MNVVSAPNNNFDIKLKQKSSSFDILLRPSDATSNIVILNLTNNYVDLGSYAMFIPSDSTKLITRDGMIFACEGYENLKGEVVTGVGADAAMYLAETINGIASIGVAGTAKITGAAVVLRRLRGKVGVVTEADLSVFRPAVLSDYENCTLNDVGDTSLREFYYAERS